MLIMKNTISVTIISLCIFLSFLCSKNACVSLNPVDPGRKYFLGWSVDSEGKEITFEVTVATTGYVGFGISKDGLMTGADMFIGGVFNNKSSYYGDYYGAVLPPPVLDKKQDWKLLEATENSTHTRLRFSRLLETCDPEDLPITGDTSKLIWAIGDTDDLANHGTEERGTVTTNFLLPEPVFDFTKYQQFDIINEMELPLQESTYWCTIHRGPTLERKHHIVALEAIVNSKDVEGESKFAPHVFYQICVPPLEEDADEFFGKFVGRPGNHCYLPSEEQTVPVNYCQESLYGWSNGRKLMVFPDDVGIPIGGQPGAVYFMLQINFENPEVLALNISAGVRSYYTSELREYEGGSIVIGNDLTPSLVIPPDTSQFTAAAHCSSECLSKHFPTGITVFNSLLHAHMAGRELKVRQFRNGTELPWIDSNAGFDFLFQENKPLSPLRTILPGDHITVECRFDSIRQKDKAAVIGGITPSGERCEVFFWYYPRQPLYQCFSTYPVEQGLSELGITEYHIESENGFETLIG